MGGSSTNESAFRSLRARIAAHSMHARNDSVAITERAREASRNSLDARLLSEIDPDENLSESERARRLEHARKAYFGRLALKSAQARRRRRSKP